MHIPKISEQLPRRGNPFSRFMGRSLMRICRWRVEGELCQSPKFVFVMAPHTSWWDFTNNFGLLLALGLHASWFIANKYTKGFVGNLLAFFGAVPVERSESRNMVGQMAEAFIQREKFVLAIFPEGTRKPVPQWKTGFWHIAKQAGVPVQLVALDYSKRATVFGPVMELSEDKEKDIQQMRDFFKSVHPKRPGNAMYTD